MFRDLHFEQTYRSDRHHIGRDFLSPALSQALTYDRAVGYFSSSALAESARGLGKFVSTGGKIRLVASPFLTNEDAQAIKDGYESRDQVIERALSRVLNESMPDPVKASVSCLAWLVSRGQLDIKIALLSDGSALGLYHEKIGILRDSTGDAVMFTGSANESAGGLLMNFESVEVFCSWNNGDADRVRSKIADFETLWSDSTESLLVMDFPQAVRDDLIRRYVPRRGEPAFDVDGNPVAGQISVPQTPGLPYIPDSLKLRQYQEDAIACWFASRLRGTFRMATGTGKTITAIALVAELTARLQRLPRPYPLFVLVLCPYQSLVDQWTETARAFGIEPIRCYLGRNYWINQLSSQLTAILAGEPFAMAISTYATFQTEAFQRELKAVEKYTLIIADEMHNAGAPGASGSLPRNAPYRLGLSATPERWHDDEGTEALFSYFGEPVFELDLDDAIRMGALTPYLYFPIIVELTTDEMIEYGELTEKIARMYGRDDSAGEMSDQLKMLLIRRSRILANASGKIPALRNAMLPYAGSTHNLVYCGDGSTSGDSESDPLELKRQIDLAVATLGNQLHMRVKRYTSETSVDSRRNILKQFAEGHLQTVVAIRCLDEGVDIPETRRAFILASSSNPRQFIQRRGRILRRAPGKDKAELYDFIAVPPLDGFSEEGFNMERRLVQGELRRVIQFAELALNGPEALVKLLELRKRYNLMDVGFTTPGVQAYEH